MTLGIKTSANEPEADVDLLDGISPADCPYACTAENCCIVSAPVCSHPHKGGLQPIHKSDPAILRRFNEARQRLQQFRLEKRAERDNRFLNGESNA
jgi:hypothetical protein